jgi:SAM-dependent methyltransferase
LKLPAAGPADLTGAATLDIMQAAPKYNRWQYDRISPYLGNRICEVGAGIGNISIHLRRTAPELLVLTDTDPFYRDLLRERLGGFPEVVVDELTLPDQLAPGRFQHYALDTVVALNVIEHIQDDVGALRSIAGMLQPGGRAVILVPALPSLFGSLDVQLGHHQRYTHKTLNDRMRRAGFRVQCIFYFNLIGTLGWLINARVRRVPRLPANQVRLFDRLVPILRIEDRISLPLGQSIVGIGVMDG